MKFLAPFLLLTGALLGCPQAPMAPPSAPIQRPAFVLWVDQDLPLSRVEAAEEEWREVTDVDFITVQIPHEYALAVPDRQLTGDFVLLVSDPWTIDHCETGPLTLACYAHHRIRFDHLGISTGQWWDRVPAHELGHAMCGLDDNEEEKESIMCKNVQCQSVHPTIKDGQRCSRALGK